MAIDSSQDGASGRPEGRRPGLPNGSIVQMFHNVASVKTIVEIRLVGMPPIHRLYCSHDKGPFQLVSEPEPALSLENVLNTAVAKLFALEVEWKAMGRGFGGGTLRVVQIDLAGSCSTTPLDLRGLLPPDSWISRLLRANDTGTTLDAVVATKVAKKSGRGKDVVYSLCALDLVNMRTKEMDSLEPRLLV